MQPQLPCNWDQQSDEGGALREDEGGKLSAALSQAASKTPHCHHHLPALPSPSLHLPRHWEALISPELVGHTFAKAPQSCSVLGQESKAAFAVVSGAACSTPETERNQQLGWRQGTGLVVLSDNNVLQHCRGSRLCN